MAVRSTVRPFHDQTIRRKPRSDGREVTCPADPINSSSPSRRWNSLLRIFRNASLLLLMFVAAFGKGAASEPNSPEEAAPTPVSDSAAKPSSGSPDDVTSGDGDAPPPKEKGTADELNLDALLDIAEKDPSQLESVRVKDSARQDSLISPDAVFTPDEGVATSVNSTGDLLSTAPGVVLRSTSAINQDARIRGYSGSQVVGVTDGMNQGKTRVDIDSLFSQVDPSLVQEIAVLPGPYSVLYGPGYAFFDARLITPGRSAEFDWDSRTSFGFNSNGQQLSWRETLQYSDRTSGGLVSVGQRLGNDYRTGHGGPEFRVPASYNVKDAYVAYGVDLSNRSRMDFTYLRQDILNTELPGVAYDIAGQHSDQWQARWNWRDDFTGRDRLQTQFWFSQTTYSVDSTRSSKRTTFSDRLIAEPYPDALGGSLYGNGLSDSWGTRLISIWGEEGLWELKTGADWRRARQRYIESDVQADGSEALFGDAFGIPKSSSDDFGVFAGATATLTDRWSVGVGQRVDLVRYGVDGTDSIATSTQFAPNGQYYPGVSTPDRTLSMSYLTTGFRATDTLTLNGGVAYAMRPPNLTELYSDQPFAPLVRFGNSFALGDSDLRSEQNLQFDAGFTSKHERTSWGMRGFHSTIHDYIGLAATNYSSFPELGTAPGGVLGRAQPFMADPNFPNQDLSADSASLGYAYRNIDVVELYGFDLMGEVQALPWLEFGGTLTFTEGINHDPTVVDAYTGTVTSVGNREGLPGIYPMTSVVSARIVEPLDRRWTLEWQTRMAYQQGHLASSLGELGTPGFAVHNIHATYRWTKHVSLRSSLLNVFDHNYFEHNSLAIVDENGNIGFVKNPGIGWFMGVECTY